MDGCGSRHPEAFEGRRQDGRHGVLGTIRVERARGSNQISNRRTCGTQRTPGARSRIRYPRGVGHNESDGAGIPAPTPRSSDESGPGSSPAWAMDVSSHHQMQPNNRRVLDVPKIPLGRARESRGYVLGMQSKSIRTDGGPPSS